MAVKIARGRGQHGKRKVVEPSDRTLRDLPPAAAVCVEVDSDGDKDATDDSDDSGMAWRPRLESLIRLLGCDIPPSDLAQMQEHVTVADSQEEPGSYRRRQWTRSLRVVQLLFVALC